MKKSRKETVENRRLQSGQLDLFEDAPLVSQTFSRPPASGCSKFDEGFSGLPAGYRNNGNFNNLGSNANWWSATENNSNNANYLNLNGSSANINNNNNKNNAQSVRCLQDSINLRPMLYAAYRDARRNKRGTLSQLKFEMDQENQLERLAQDLENRTYELSPAMCFVNTEPVKREVIAADFRDRVVHHLLFSWINPILDKQFIHDSYSCRDGKGTLYAVERAYQFMESASKSWTRECYVLRLDISGFFMSINRDILYRLCMQGLRRGRFMGVPNKDLCVFLLKKFIYNNPLENAFFRGDLGLWQGLPKNKSLRYAKEGCGLPIGNLTSQLFGNVYLNLLDHFVKQNLGMRYYGRYVDDMVLFHENPEKLKEASLHISDFLEMRLLLKLNHKKFYLQPISRGFSFLGTFIRPGMVLPGRRLKRNFLKALQSVRESPRKNRSSKRNRLISYCGLIGYYNALISSTLKPVC